MICVLTFRVEGDVEGRSNAVSYCHVVVLQGKSCVALARRGVYHASKVNRHLLRVSASHGHVLRASARKVGRDLARLATRRASCVARAFLLAHVNCANGLHAAGVDMINNSTNFISRI